MSVFAEQLKRIRQERKLSQEDLAQELFISRQAISKWENGEATPDMENLIKLADIFGTSLDYLILGKEPEKRVERVVEIKETTQMTFWQFLADYWWIIFPVGSFLSWFLPHVLPKIFG